MKKNSIIMLIIGIIGLIALITYAIPNLINYLQNNFGK